MGLFSKRPNNEQQVYIKSTINEVQTQYKQVATTTRVDWFLESYKRTYSLMEDLLNVEKKYPTYFGNQSPSFNMKKIKSERAEMETQFVDRFILSIEKNLLNYSTARGKRNNFNKEVDKFKFYADEFLPETIDYFNKTLNEHFAEYVQFSE